MRAAQPVLQNTVIEFVIFTFLYYKMRLFIIKKYTNHENKVNASCSSYVTAVSRFP